MSTPNSQIPTPDPGLPPVEPPSGMMILRLFLVPGLIVGILVGLFLVGPSLARWFGQLVGRPAADSRTSDLFLRDIDSGNADIRWRAASDLAQVLLRKDELAADADFSLQIAERLQSALENSAAAEKAYAAKSTTLSEGEREVELKKLAADRNLGMFLAACLGNCMLPTGVSQLKEMALQSIDMEADALAERRRRALFALATLGENLKRFDKLSQTEQAKVLTDFETAGEHAKQAKWARESLEYLRARQNGKATDLGVLAVLLSCAEDEDPSLRNMAAFAANFWRGDVDQESKMLARLNILARDDGRGEDALEERLARNPVSKESRDITKRKGFTVQVQAAIALCRRESALALSHASLLKEMLDPNSLREVYIIRRRGKEEPNEALVVLTVTDTLKAVGKLAKNDGVRGKVKEQLSGQVAALLQSENSAIRTEAKETQLALDQ